MLLSVGPTLMHLNSLLNALHTCSPQRAPRWTCLQPKDKIPWMHNHDKISGAVLSIPIFEKSAEIAHKGIAQSDIEEGLGKGWVMRTSGIQDMTVFVECNCGGAKENGIANMRQDF